MINPTLLATVLVLLSPGSAFGATLPRHDASSEALSVPRDVQGEQPSRLQKRNPLAAVMYFGQFALEYAMGKGLDSIFGDEEAPPPLSAADLNAFGDQLIEDIENIVVDAISQFAEDRDTISVDAHIKTLVAWRPTAEAGHLDGLQGDERTLERKNGEFDQIMGFLKTPSYTAFATPYFLAAAGAKLHLWRLRIRIAEMIADADPVAAQRSAGRGVNNTASYTARLKEDAKSYADSLEQHFLPRARTAITKMVARTCWDTSISGKTDQCRVTSQCKYEVKLPSGVKKTVFRGDPANGYHEKTGCSGFACLVPQCESSDWSAAREGTRQLPNFQSTLYMDKYYKPIMYKKSELGATLLTPDFFNVVAGFRYTAKHGMKGGFVRDESKAIRACDWVRKVHQYDMSHVDSNWAQAKPAEMDVCQY